MYEGKIALSGFDLEPIEKSIVDKIIKTHERKIREKVGYKEIKLNMKKSQKAKTFLHEIHGRLITDGKNMQKHDFEAKSSDYNLFSAVDEVLEKLLKEAENKKRTPKEQK